MRLYYRFCRTICQLCGLIGGWRSLYAERAPLDGGVLLISNHQSFLDPVLTTLAIRRECNYMARDSLFRNRLFRWLIESLNAFPVKRGTADIGAVKETLRRLKRGGLVVAFPEATRTPDGKLQAFQSGFVVVARKAGVPILPTALLGAYEAWPRSRKLPRRHPILTVYGEPIPAAQLEEWDDQTATRAVRSRILELMEAHRDHRHIRGRLAVATEPLEGAAPGEEVRVGRRSRTAQAVEGARFDRRDAQSADETSQSTK